MKAVKFLLFLVLVFLLLASCNEDITNHSICDTPVITPGTGNYNDYLTVTITCATEGADIHFTLDGTIPNTNSDMYLDPIFITAATTVKAIATKDNMDISAVATATFNIIDTIAPDRPDLIEHRGDTGDGPMIINGIQVVVTDENNGIDADTGGDWINLRWEPFIHTDLSHLTVFRFSESNPTPDSIASVQASDIFYQDRDPNLIEQEWYSYFVKLYDINGNYSVSDTVSYGLLAKCNLFTPEDEVTVSHIGLKLKWYKGGSSATRFRVLTWNDTSNQLIWFTDIYPTIEDEPLEVFFPVYSPPLPSGTVIRWRVDAFNDSSIHGTSLGSESLERTFTIE